MFLWKKVNFKVIDLFKNLNISQVLIIENELQPEGYNITEKCRPCSSDDYTEHIECKQTGYIETIYFSKSGYKYQR